MLLELLLCKCKQWHRGAADRQFKYAYTHLCEYECRPTHRSNVPPRICNHSFLFHHPSHNAVMSQMRSLLRSPAAAAVWDRPRAPRQRLWLCGSTHICSHTWDCTAAFWVILQSSLHESEKSSHRVSSQIRTLWVESQGGGVVRGATTHTFFSVCSRGGEGVTCPLCGRAFPAGPQMTSECNQAPICSNGLCIRLPPRRTLITHRRPHAPILCRPYCAPLRASVFVHMTSWSIAD